SASCSRESFLLVLWESVVIWVLRIVGGLAITNLPRRPGWLRTDLTPCVVEAGSSQLSENYETSSAPRREVAESSGFSLHAGIAAKASQRDKLERLARYVARPPVANERLSLTEGGDVRCALKTAYRDGATHVIFEPEDFIARLAALVPKPRAHQIRYHGVFAPASPDR